MISEWPTSLPKCPVLGSVRGGAQGSLASFQPSLGPSIDRPRTTARVELFGGLRFAYLTRQDVADFQDWFHGSLKSGATAFVFRHPISNAVVKAKIIAEDQPYSIGKLTSKGHDLSISLMVLPGSLWFAPYVRDGSCQIPAFVADYDQGVYGIGSEKQPASALPSIAGTYDLYTTDSADVEVFAPGTVVSAGDITEAQPAGVKSIVGFTA